MPQTATTRRAGEILDLSSVPLEEQGLMCLSTFKGAVQIRSTSWSLTVAVVGALLAGMMNQLTRSLWAAFLVWWNS